MPIHTSWKSMLRGMIRTYCRGKKGKRTAMKFADGSKVLACDKARSVFYATATKKCGKGCEAKPMPKGKPVRESVENFILLGDLEEEYEQSQLIEWYLGRKTFMESAPPSTVGPRWIKLAQKVLASPKFSDKVKAYWRKRLQKWCKTHKHPACAKVKGETKGKGKQNG